MYIKFSDLSHPAFSKMVQDGATKEDVLEQNRTYSWIRQCFFKKLRKEKPLFAWVYLDLENQH